MHNKCNALESSRNHPHLLQSMEKLSSTKPVPGAKKVGDHCSIVYMYMYMCVYLYVYNMHMYVCVCVYIQTDIMHLEHLSIYSFSHHTNDMIRKMFFKK